MLFQATLLFSLILVAASGPTTSPEESISSPATEVALCPCSSVGNTTTTTPSSSPPVSHHPSNQMIHGMTCMCHAGPAPAARDDYRYSPGLGAHKLHTRAATWNDARKMCNEEGGHLAIVNSLAEAHILMDIFNKAGPVKGAAYPDIGFVGIHDLYKESEWTTVLGESLFKTGYTVWSDKYGGQPDNGGRDGNQDCGVFLKEGGLDDVNCDVPFAFFCELPMSYILH